MPAKDVVELCHYDVTFPSDDEACVQSAKDLVLQFRPEWSEAKLKHEFFLNGITNRIVSFWSESTKKGKYDRVVFRIYGNGTELILDRKNEIQIMQQLHASGCAPPVYGTFNNGVAYGYFPGVILDTKTVRDPRLGALIAKALAQMHCIQLTEAQRKNGAGLFNQIQKFINQMPKDFDDPDRNERYKKEIPSPKQLRHEFDWVRTEAEALESPLVMCHNDLQVKNVVYNEKYDSVSFIDYEYACQNFQAFDIATHFNEYAGIDGDVDFTVYPDRQHQMAWLGHYLSQWHAAKSLPFPTQSDLERLYVQVNRFAPISHFFWATWAVGQAAHSKIDFDYYSYGSLRMAWYFKTKKEFASLKLH